MSYARPPHFAQKILSASEAIDAFARPRQDKVVFTNGCFDILHRGHVEYLAHARSLGHRLIVGLNSDRSVRVLKGEGRPINPVDDRAMVLAALEDVDAVVEFDDDTPLALIAAILPDILVKGGDYEADSVVGAAEVRAAGGDVVIAPFVAGRSTTRVLEQARSPEC